jgi:hypothetical protein
MSIETIADWSVETIANCRLPIEAALPHPLR